MTDPREIANLLRLLDAESESVRGAVQRELLAQGPALEAFAIHADADLDHRQRYHLHDLLRATRQAKSLNSWTGWFQVTDPHEQIELALSHLADAIDDHFGPPTPVDLLDDLAAQFIRSGAPREAGALNQFLFGSGRLSGDTEDYYHPRNSNLREVIVTGKGLPITLACVFMLVGRRMGIHVLGFNMPGHFLARADVDGQPQLFDCFNNGKVIDHEELAMLSRNSGVDVHPLLRYPPSPVEIVLRTLYNLLNAFWRSAAVDKYRMIQGLLKEVKKHFSESGSETPAESSFKPLFKRGQLVRHRHQGYRGVVVDVDPICGANDDWFQSHKSPDRNQPWYHVLVDGSYATTYAAQSNLLADSSGEEIKHPLLSLYFEGFEDGRYSRNNTPWISPE